MAEPFAAALRAAIASTDLTLQGVQTRLAQRGITIGLATLSAWQNGTRRPERAASLAAVTELEQVLQLPALALTMLLGPPRRRGRVARLPAGISQWRDATPDGEVARSLFRAMTGDDGGGLLTLSQHEQVLIGADRDLRERRLSLVVEAYRNVDRHLLTYRGDPGCDVDKLSLHAGNSCRVGQVRVVPERGLLAAELLFDRMLRPGDTALLEYTITDRSRVECREAYRNFPYGVRLYALRVQFRAAALPVRYHEFAGRADSDGERRAAVALDSRRALHSIVRDSRPGSYGLRWAWT